MQILRLTHFVSAGTIIFLLLAFPCSLVAKTDKDDHQMEAISLLLKIAKHKKVNLVVQPDIRARQAVYIHQPIQAFFEDQSYIKLNDLLNTLELHVYQSNDNLHLVSLSKLKHLTGKIYNQQQTIKDSEWVYSDIAVSNSICVGQLVPMLRTLLPRHAHMAQNKTSNSMILFDRKANIDKIRSLIQLLTKNTNNKKAVCHFNERKIKTTKE